jgi:hypothetical protein
MSADRHATRFGRMLELSMTSFRYCQLPPVSFEHPNHVTYLHVTTISEEKNPIPRFAPRIIEFMRSWQPNVSSATAEGSPLERRVRRRISCCDIDSERCEHLSNARHRSSRIEEYLDSGREDRGLFRPTRVALRSIAREWCGQRHHLA